MGSKRWRNRISPLLQLRHGNRNSVCSGPKKFKGYGLEGIRVVDASAMPYIPNANINAPTLMLAEKTADIILQNTPLPEQVQKFYRT